MPSASGGKIIDSPANRLAAGPEDRRREPPLHPAGQFVWLREQFVSGRSVRGVIESRALTPEELRRLAGHALEALEAGERVRIVHRDVKPDNLMLDAGGSFWLLDFGIARHLDLESATPTAQHYGVFTPGYAPPNSSTT